jgi:ABC-type dipeptide/oligopeptide/nickel transport system permease component
MAEYIIRRIIWLFVVLFAVSLITFALMHAVPGGPFSQEKKLPQEIIDNLNRKYHLDEPLWQQYIRYMSDILIPRYNAGELSTDRRSDYLVTIQVGDGNLQWMNFGPSYASKTRTVNDIFRDNLKVSAQLGVLAIMVGSIIGIPLGILAALRQNTIVDYTAMAIAIIGVSIPAIVSGPIFQWLFAVQLGWFPVAGWGSPENAVLPALVLGLGTSALLARLTRASLLQVIREDYIRTARAKGLRESTITVRHALKNSLIPVVTVYGPLLAALITGTFVVETIFGIPGMGRYFVNSISNRDYTVIMGTILLYSVLLVIANMFVDIVYAFLDPRIRLN